jgi:hypothetical protein
MKKRTKQTLFFIGMAVLAALLLLGVVLFFVLPLLSRNEKIENMENPNQNQEPLEIVIARYNEDLEWLKEEPFNQYPTIVYNKGPNDDFYHAPKITRITPLPNVGRESHTILYHIIQHYDQLAEVTVFLPGSSQLPNKLPKAKSQVTECVKHSNTVIMHYTSHPTGVHKEMYDFVIDDYVSTDAKNKGANPERQLLPSEIRPFGKWHEDRFPEVVSKHVCYNCIMGIHRKHIVQHPKSYYEKLIRELETHTNPEVGHYYERAWMSVFHPLDDAFIL